MNFLKPRKILLLPCLLFIYQTNVYANLVPGTLGRSRQLKQDKYNNNQHKPIKNGNDGSGKGFSLSLSAEVLGKSQVFKTLLRDF